MLNFFLNWLYDNRKINFNGVMIFPKINHPINYSLISYYNYQEISQILNSIDTTTSTGKRNYAIVNLLAYLGMRRDDIRTLKFKNIDWENNLLKFHQNKTSKLTILPIPNIVKLSLIDYIKNARPNIKSEYIFIKEDGNLYYIEYLSVLVSRIIKASGVEIKNRKISCHIFRHSRAMHLLDAGIDLETIKKLLGYNSLKSTEIYAKASPKKVEEAISKNTVAIKIKRKYSKKKEENLLQWLKNDMKS